MKKLDGPLTLTTYVNLLEHYYYGSPKAITKISIVSKDIFALNQRNRDEICLLLSQNLFSTSRYSYPNLNDEERARRISDISNINFLKS